jgi:hypothetical protein
MTSAPSNFTISQTLPVSKITRPVGAPGHKFCQFNLDYARILSDDYVHDKFLTVKYTGKGNLFTVASKGTLNFKLGADKREQPVTSSEVKIVTNIEGRNLETKFNNRGAIRVWGNLGTYSIVKPIIVTSKLKTTNAFKSFSTNLALEYQGKGVNVWTALHLKEGLVPYLDEKMIFRVDRFQFGYAAKLNLTAYTLARYNLFLAYQERDFGVVAEHVSRNKTKIELGKLLLAATYRRAGNDYIAKLSYRPHHNEPYRFKVGGVLNINRETALRFKINNNTKLSLSTKYKYNNNLTVVAGTQVNLLDPASTLTKRTIPVPLGFSLQFNYA